ncbi:hypothetical protein B0J13DRAFT_513606 [Dactylonectria estremocensis]|uniref:Caib baif family enzyme n=1 Tax=Dactylonectria estremocensis TaxID=1079267 RepID=A0A9P9IGA9_9HYPO|nr:hypothetical protein B0J13DRAFT_513606 [Dactylonectria estremocensis]
MPSEPICHIVAPVGMLGYGFDEVLTAHELAKLVPSGIPTAIILDSGSTDSGPEKLALGTTTCPRTAYMKDLAKMMKLIHTFRVPLIFGSAGGDGTDEHVKLMGEIIAEIAAEKENRNYCIKAISIFSDIKKETILERLQAGRVQGCGPNVPPLTPTDVEASPRVVAQIGPEPFIDAMEAHPDFNVIIGGRAYDPAPFAAFASFQLKRQHSNISSADIQARYGGFLHMGKIMECGGQCSTPKSPGAVATVYPSGVFDIRPMSPGSRCTPFSVAAHALYENARPDVLRGPGGALHLEDTNYEQLEDGRTVRVSGSQYRSSKAQGLPHQFKLEAARVTGYRSMFMGGIRDFILIGEIDDLLPRVKAYVKEQYPDATGIWDLDFHVYGKGQSTAAGPGELFIICEVIAQTQALATSLAAKARVAMIHGPYPGMKATAGNFGFGIGGFMEIGLGPAAKFSVYHLMDLEPGEERLRLGSQDTHDQLLHASVSVIGNGQPCAYSAEFGAQITRLQKTLQKPSNSEAIRVVESSVKVRSESPRTLSDLARVLRSKNAGPFDITIDVIFTSEAIFAAVKRSKLLSPDNVARALGIPKEDVVWMGFFEPALAFKVTIPRVRAGKRTSAGGFMENDVHGSQQHIGLATLKLPEAVVPSVGRVALKQSWQKLVYAAAICGISTMAIAKYMLFGHKFI